MEKIKSFIITTLLGGLTIVLPVVILVVVFGWLFNFVQDLIAPLTGLIEAKSDIKGLVADGLVLIVIFALFFLVGIIVKTSVGRFLFNTVENNILKVAPGYTLIKDTVLQILGSKKSPFSTVALAQIFGNETLVTSFVTDEHDDGSFTVFVPTGPNPTSGNIYHLKSEFVHPVNVSVEEAMRSIISCGAGSTKLVENYKNRS